MGQDEAMEHCNVEWARLRTSMRGLDVLEAEHVLGEWVRARGLRFEEIDVALMARVMSDGHWARKHPLSALALAWKHRGSRPLHRSLRWLWRPRFAG